MTRRLVFVEIDLDYCANTYGVSPCTASIPTTGAIKCFNTLRTCQDRANFVNEPVTLRFAMPTDALPADIDCIPSIKDFSVTPAKVSLGKDLGQRAKLTVTFTDHPFADTGTGFDKYLADRDYDPYSQGSFWGKFRARNPYVRGRSIRLIQGEVGQALADMETRHFILDSLEGIGLDGEFSLVAKDVLKLADDDRAKAPRANTGFLTADIDSSTTSASLSPSGIGNAEYPSSGYCVIGGSEICSFTRSGDALTLVRAQLGTPASSHSAQDRVQLCLRYVSQNPAVIISDLLKTYADVPDAFIDLDEWKTEVETFLNRLYGATICEPTGVASLIAELIEQAGLVVWWDDVNQKVRLQVLRGIEISAMVFSDDTILEKSLQPKEQPDSRLTRIQTYYGLIDPLKKVNEPTSFRSIAETADEDAESDYGSAVIKTIFARWIPQFGRTNALRVNDILLSRFTDPPRLISFSLPRADGIDIDLARGCRLQSAAFQDVTGAPADVPAQVIQINPRPDRIDVQVEEMLFTGEIEDLTNRTITIDANSYNLDLRTIHDMLYPAPVTPGEGETLTVNFVIQSGVIVGSTSTSSPALDIGTWPAGITLNLRNFGRVQGRGGDGGRGGRGGAGPIQSGLPGSQGGYALRARAAFNLFNFGKIFGGGGGGGGSSGGVYSGSGGGGGAGTPAGGGGYHGDNSNFNGHEGLPGTADVGGLGGSPPPAWGGAGGGPGEPGSPGENGGGAGGPAGIAIDGLSYATIEVNGDIRGTVIN